MPTGAFVHGFLWVIVCTIVLAFPASIGFGVAFMVTFLFALAAAPMTIVGLNPLVVKALGLLCVIASWAYWVFASRTRTANGLLHLCIFLTGSAATIGASVYVVETEWTI